MSQKEWRKPHIFVSYVREDDAVVNWLCAALKARGLQLWRDKDEILPGQDWRAAIRKAIENGDYFLACFSDAYVKRERTYMNSELNLAIRVLQEFPRERAWFIPVLLSRCDVPDWEIDGNRTLRDLQWVELYDDTDEGVGKILRVIFSSTKLYPPVRLSAIGILDKAPLLAHDKGGWGPERENSDAREHPLELQGDVFTIVPQFLELDERFKIAVVVSDEAEARSIVKQRRDAGVLVGGRGESIDFDAKHNTLWLMADNYEVDKLGEWNQNNVYRPKI